MQSDLNRYRAELADVMLQADIQVDIGDFLRFADYFFDDVFSSWAVLDCIRNTAQQAASARQKVLQIQDRLQLHGRSWNRKPPRWTSSTALWCWKVEQNKRSPDGSAERLFSVQSRSHSGSDRILTPDTIPIAANTARRDEPP